jgi:hypothetical protein
MYLSSRASHFGGFKSHRVDDQGEKVIGADGYLETVEEE